MPTTYPREASRWHAASYTAGCSRACTAALLLTLVACGPAVTRATHYYADRSDALMDVYVREGVFNAPGVLLLHFGGWTSGAKGSEEVQARRLAARGYVAAALDYRLAPEHPFPAAIRDVFCALAWLRERAPELGLDASRLAVSGYSAGGHLAALAGVGAEEPYLQGDCPSGVTFAPRAVIAGAGVSDFSAYEDNEQVRAFLAGAPSEVPEATRLASPLRYARPGLPPFLLYSGAADELVPLSQIIQFERALADAGNEVERLELPSTTHTFGPGAALRGVNFELSSGSPEVQLATDAFLERMLGRP